MIKRSKNFKKSLIHTYSQELLKNKEVIERLKKIQDKYDNDYQTNLGDKADYLSNCLQNLIQSYRKNYSEEVIKLKKEIQQVSNPRSVNFFIGKGSTTYTYKINLNGKKYAVIIYGLDYNTKESPIDELYEIFRKVIAGILAIGIDKVPKILGYSLKDLAIVMELAPGDSLAKNFIGDSEKFSDDEIAKLMQTVMDINAKGLCIDYYPDNLIYDKDNGFSIIDLCLQKGTSLKLTQEIMSLRFMLIGKISPDTDKHSEEYEEKRKESLDVGIRILDIVKNRFPKLLTKFKNANKNEILNIGSASLYCEYDPNNSYDLRVLQKAQILLKN